MEGDKILITGAAGTIGTILFNGLKGQYPITNIDKKTIVPRRENTYRLDIASEYSKFKQLANDHRAIIHLAWNSDENWKSNYTAPDNKKMIENVYKAAHDTGILKVIMASSIHAADIPWDKAPYQQIMKSGEVPKSFNMISPTAIHPQSPYGDTKIYLETLGRQWAKNGLFVVCIRFGTVNASPKYKLNMKGKREALTWLTHRDCVDLVNHIITVNAKCVNNDYHLIYGISKNTGRIHSYENELGWYPKDDANS